MNVGSYTFARRIAVATIFAVALGCGATVAVKAAQVTIVESGSTLFYPLFRLWIPEYARLDRAVRLGANATGSGTGVARVISGAAQIGISDAYMSDEDLRSNPQILNIPLAISAQTVNYNMPGLNRASLRLSGPILAAIYSGTIRQWDDAQIAAMNPGIKLPHRDIIPVRRADGSGDTFMFSQYLTYSTPSWGDGIDFGTTISWPSVGGELTATGNPGMVEALRRHPYSVGYIGISLQSAISRAELGTAKLENQAGKFLLPTAESVAAGAAVLDTRTPADERLSLVFAPGANSYPIISYEYAVVSSHQPSADTAAALRAFLLWSVEPNGGNNVKDLGYVHFLPLPDFVRALSVAQIRAIHPL